MKPVHVEFHKIKELREGNNDKTDNFEMDILDENALYKALEGPKNIDEEIGGSFMRPSIINTSNKQ